MRYLAGMADHPGMIGRRIEIVGCPPALAVDALSLALADLTPEQRREFANVTPGGPVEALCVALSEGEVVGAAWGQRQPGSTAIFWPPRWRKDADADASNRLACAVAHSLDQAGIRMSQVLLPNRESPAATQLQAAGFDFLTDLAYLTWESAAVADDGVATALDFEKYRDSQLDRFVSVIDRRTKTRRIVRRWVESGQWMKCSPVILRRATFGRRTGCLCEQAAKTWACSC
jgi:hypothetical protein